VAVGERAAAGILTLGANDGRFPANALDSVPGSDPSLADATPSPSELAQVSPSTLPNADRFRLSPLPSPTSRRYARDYDEVKSLGGLMSADRTADQTELALFWSANYFALWNQALRDIADAHVPDIGRSARLFALATLATAEAVLSASEASSNEVFRQPT